MTILRSGMMTIRRRRGLIVGVPVIIAIVGGLIVWGLACTGHILDDTIYARGYSEKGFQSVQPGMSKDQVRTLLGKPLKEEVFDCVGSTPAGGDIDAIEIWRYSSPGTFGWRHKEVYFNRESNVVCKESRWEE
jgi:hypothetical protein